MNQQQLQTAEAIARRMANTTAGLDAAYWLLAASLLHLAQNPQQISQNGKLPHNESIENKNLIVVR